MEIIWRLQRAPVKFLLDYEGSTEPTTDFRVKLHSLNLLVRRPQLSEAICVDVEKILSNRNARYYYNSMEVNWRAIPTGNADNLSD